jgi:hypothetical protein
MTSEDDVEGWAWGMTLGGSSAGGCRRGAPRDATGAGGGCLRWIWVGAGGRDRVGGGFPHRALGWAMTEPPTTSACQSSSSGHCRRWCVLRWLGVGSEITRRATMDGRQSICRRCHSSDHGDGGQQR